MFNTKSKSDHFSADSQHNTFAGSVGTSEIMLLLEAGLTINFVARSNARTFGHLSQQYVTTAAIFQRNKSVV